MMTCRELALTAQLICLSDHTPVCTDNGSIAQLIDVPACSSTEPSQRTTRVPRTDRSKWDEAVRLLTLDLTPVHAHIQIITDNVS